MTVTAVRDRLRDTYGHVFWEPHGSPLDELVLTVLSQSTNDRNRDVAYERLRDRFGSWEAVRDAPVEDVEAAIRPGGISQVKSRRIQDILRGLPEDLDLSFLADVPLDEARDFLTALPGVGRKTAACVLLFSYGRRDVPVDTHVGRVATRLGWLGEKAGSDEQHDELTGLTPPGEELELHINLLRHGRRTCHARRPRCPECPLESLCPAANRFA